MGLQRGLESRRGHIHCLPRALEALDRNLAREPYLWRQLDRALLRRTDLRLLRGQYQAAEWQPEVDQRLRGHGLVGAMIRRYLPIGIGAAMLLVFGAVGATADRDDNNSPSAQSAQVEAIEPEAKDAVGVLEESRGPGDALPNEFKA